MNALRSDEVTTGLATDATRRRGMLAGLSAGALAAVATRLSAVETAAKKRKKRKKKKQPVCTRCPKICESASVVTCKPPTNIEVELCVCAWTTTGNIACIDFRQVTCSPTDQCQFDGDCGANQACILVDDVNCCPSGDDGNACAPVCATS